MTVLMVKNCIIASKNTQHDFWVFSNHRSHTDTLFEPYHCRKLVGNKCPSVDVCKGCYIQWWSCWCGSLDELHQCCHNIHVWGNYFWHNFARFVNEPIPLFEDAPISHFGGCRRGHVSKQFLGIFYFEFLLQNVALLHPLFAEKCFQQYQLLSTTPPNSKQLQQHQKIFSAKTEYLGPGDLLSLPFFMLKVWHVRPVIEHYIL